MNSTKLRQEFHNVLEQTIIPSSLSQNEKIKRFDTWSPYSNSSAPKKLYRYRKYDTLSIEAFYYDQMWFSPPSKMNDGFDTRLCYNKKEFFGAIESEFSDDSMFQFFDQVLSTDNLYKSLVQLFITKDDLQDRSIFFSKPLIQTLKSMRDSLMSDNQSIIDYLMTSMQPFFKIGCLSENISSPEMWGHYASSEEGFALQYDCSEIYSPQENPHDTFPKICTIYPVMYQKNRYNLPVSYLMFMFRQKILTELLNLLRQANPNITIPSELIKSIMSTFNSCPDESMFTKVALYKSTEWQVEKEWRILCNSMDPAFMQLDFVHIVKKPTAVYLGRRMKSNSRKLITDIAKSKNLPIYEMAIDDTSPKYKLTPVKYTK